MKIMAVDPDRDALASLECGLKTVFPETGIILFDNALNSFKYFTSHKEETALIYFPLVIRSFDGFRYTELIRQASFSSTVILTVQTDNDEIRELIRLNGGNRYLSKPVTAEKIRTLAKLEQELCFDRHEGRTDVKCRECIYHWCKLRRRGPV